MNSSDLDVEDDADERNMFLPGEASDSDDDHEGDTTTPAERKEERRRILSNSNAQVSRVDISNEDGYHVANGNENRNGSARETLGGGSGGGGLSAKAGIILVSDLSISFC